MSQCRRAHPRRPDGRETTRRPPARSGVAATWLVLLCLGAASLLTAQGPPRVSSLRFSKPATLASLDMQKLRGEPSRLAWSPEGRQLYVQTLEGGFGKPGAALRHYVLDAATGRLQESEIEPGWASEYWTAKSGQNSPDDPPLRIELKTEGRQERTTSIPQGGDLARGGTAPTMSANDELNIASRETIPVIILLFQREVIGQFVNSVLVPGLTYGWGPMGARIMVFAAQKSGRVVVIDDRGDKKEIAGSKDALLPAWSPDGDRLAWLEKDGRRRFKLQISRVSVG